MLYLLRNFERANAWANLLWIYLENTLLVYWWLDYENVFTAIKKGFLTTFAFDFFGLKLSDQFLGYKIRTKFTPIAKLVQIECYICYENFNVRMHERICCKFVLRTSLIFWLFNYENVFTALKKAFWQHLHSIFWGLKLSVQFLSYKIRTKFTPIAKSVQMWCYLCYENFNVRMHERILLRICFENIPYFWCFGYEYCICSLRAQFNNSFVGPTKIKLDRCKPGSVPKLPI
jgi:hypothetical protein